MPKKKYHYVVAYRGEFTNEEKFIERLAQRNEMYTNGRLHGMSIGRFLTEKLDDRWYDLYLDQLKGIGAGSIAFVKEADFLAKGAVIKPDPLENFPNHALMSEIDAVDAFNLLNRSGFNLRM